MAGQETTVAPPVTTPPDADGDAVRRPVLLVGAVGALLMLVGAGGASLWTDEAATVSAATRPWGELVAMAGGLDAVHTAYYAFMHVWIGVFGTSELALRSASALAVGLVAAGTWVLAARLGGRGLAWWAAATVLLLPRVTWMGAEARPFAFATAAGVWGTVLLLAAVRRGGAARWVGYAALMVVAVLTNLYTLLLLPAHAVTLLLGHRSRATVVRWCGAAGAVAVVVGPFLVLAAGQTGQLGRHTMSAVELARNVVVNQWFLGETPTVYSRDAAVVAAAGAGAGSWWRPASVLLAGVAVAVVAYALLRWWRHRPVPAPVRAVLVWTVPWVVVPTVVVVAWAVVSQTYSSRYLAFCAPAVAILLAAALRELPTRPLRVAAVVALVACALPVLVSQRTEHAKSGADWREVAAVVGDACDPGDGAYFAPRAAPTGSTVRLTTRGVSVAYPEGYDGLVDVTLVADPLETDDLVGRSALLRDSGARLASLDTLCVVRRHDLPAAVRDADDVYLSEGGWVVRDRWEGPLDEVVVLERAPG
ncbi:glycosyltransferase family 39 protein [Cellulomonas wangsupingiae]|uniref:Glycosyltransferase family 39 protein n=1 Tax=Cellulomonas wangsupingiae TaxID=2968085 RepID=A0ABY5KAN1_9CELL|nr:glycosyltransferase family 39 protein [Cellulomonas wangsupingiae]MCC2334349.1 glycosyltransferase family 39 protein [Cellulomonas wangsupingiae]UUI66021.1 glycosyltransferase family 39 protein [Cellulomonas wangsupingiae]